MRLVLRHEENDFEFSIWRLADGRDTLSARPDEGSGTGREYTVHKVHFIFLLQKNDEDILNDNQ